MSGGFPAAARRELAISQQRRNLAHATRTIREKRARAVGEVADWEDLREAGKRIKDDALEHLDEHLERLEASVERAGGHVHWARDAEEANAIVARLVHAAGSTEVIKAKSLATDEIGLNAALGAEGITAYETDLAELIIQLGDDVQSHILVPAIHRNREEIRALFARTFDDAGGLTSDPASIVRAARRHLRRHLLAVGVGVTGANFAVAETGTICLVESEGNARMCSTLPRTLITVMGIEKVLPRVEDLAVMLQLLPRSATGERMNPYTSLWSGVTVGDGPEEFHLVLLDGGRTQVLEDEVGRAALRCIRCSACLNVCPVYGRTGGHAYESIYPGPIGAILTPQLTGLDQAPTLPWASSLCGACYDACPVKIDIPSILIHLRGRVTREVSPADRSDALERLTMRALGRVFARRATYERAQRAARRGQWPLARGGTIDRLPGPLEGWSSSRDLRPVPEESFRDWWRNRGGDGRRG